MVPYDKDLRDYPQRFEEALAALSTLTNLEGEPLVLEIVSARKDVFLVRSDQETPDGSIPFVEARRLINGVEVMLKSAAASTLRPRASTAGPKARLVTNFFEDDVRMGHTMRGSFVMTVLAADAELEKKRYADWLVRRQTQNMDLPPVEEPAAASEVPAQMQSFSRRVMSHLATGLATAEQILRTDDRSVSLERAVDAGVTLQMLESVRSMTSSDVVRSLDMSFRWSRQEPLDLDTPSRITMNRQESAATPAFIERIRKQPDVLQDAVTGQVVRLERADGAADGQVVIDGHVGDDRRKVRVPLSGASYRAALAAHEAHTPIRVTGTLVRKERGWKMEPGATLATFSEDPA